MATGKEVIDGYLKLSDIMFQALKARKYRIFEMTLAERRKLIELVEKRDSLFCEYDAEQKAIWRHKIQEYDQRIESEMKLFKSELEHDLNKVHASKVKLRKHANVKNYYSKNYGKHGSIIDRLK